MSAATVTPQPRESFVSCLRALNDLVISPACVVCHRRLLAGTAGPQFLLRHLPLCLPCQDRFWVNPALVQPPALPKAGFPVVSAGSYTGALRELLITHKTRPTPLTSAALAGLVEGALRCWWSDQQHLVERFGSVLVVPVPTRPGARRSRRGDPLQAMVTALRREFPEGLRVQRVRSARLFQSARPARDQVGLSRQQRLDNLADSWQVGSARALAKVRQQAVHQLTPVLLVDDIVTTGATLAEIRRVLTEAGIPVAGAVTVASSTLHSR